MNLDRLLDAPLLPPTPIAGLSSPWAPPLVRPAFRLELSAGVAPVAGWIPTRGFLPEAEPEEAPALSGPPPVR
ncbi:MAG TPA: hypothetical protein PKY30_06615, partial [Myxococcota bacterium]|nr:hypothetical protein [Myxococcota bacterium]